MKNFDPTLCFSVMLGVVTLFRNNFTFCKWLKFLHILSNNLAHHVVYKIPMHPWFAGWFFFFFSSKANNFTCSISSINYFLYVQLFLVPFFIKPNFSTLLSPLHLNCSSAPLHTPCSWRLRTLKISVYPSSEW